MEDKPKELWEREVDERINVKLTPIKRELQQLKHANDAIANQHAQMLLETQQVLSALKIDTLFNTSI